MNFLWVRKKPAAFLFMLRDFLYQEVRSLASVTLLLFVVLFLFHHWTIFLLLKDKEENLTKHQQFSLSHLFNGLFSLCG